MIVIDRADHVPVEIDVTGFPPETIRFSCEAQNSDLRAQGAELGTLAKMERCRVFCAAAGEESMEDCSDHRACSVLRKFATSGTVRVSSLRQRRTRKELLGNPRTTQAWSDGSGNRLRAAMTALLVLSSV